MRGLYAILDVTTLDARGISLVDAARAVAASGAACVQIRAKGEGARRTLELLRAARAVAGDTPVFANDRPDLALLAGVQGVHVGQDDVPPGLVKFLAEQRATELRVGLSTHDRDQLLAALDEPIDYVAIGPVFDTSSKANPDARLGVDAALALAREVHERRPELPVCAIGGITLETAPLVASEFDLVAVIGALFSGASGGAPREDEASADALGVRARSLVEAIRGARRESRDAPSSGDTLGASP